jgi:hypothetical protein
MLRPVLVFLALLSLACAGVDQPSQPAGYDQPVQPSGYGQPVQPGSPLQPAQPVNYGQQQAGPPPSNAYTIMGPAQSPDGGVMWVDSLGRITGMYAEGFLMFGMNGQLYWARDPYGGWYGVGADGQLAPLQGMPQELMVWPGVQTVLPGGYTLPAPQAPPQYTGGGGGYDPSLQGIQTMNDMYHDTNMTIIENMNSPSVDYYDQDYQYIGTW